MAAHISRQDINVLIYSGCAPYFLFPVDAMNLPPGQGEWGCCSLGHKVNGITIPCDKHRLHAVLRRMIQDNMRYLRSVGENERAIFYAATEHQLLDGLGPCDVITENGKLSEAGLDVSAVKRLEQRVEWDSRDANSAITTGWSLLLAAALADDLAAVRQLIDLGSADLINLALRDRWPDLCCFPAGLTPLMAAMAFSQFEIVRRLLSAQADPNAFDRDGRGLDAFTMACVFGRAENVKQWLHVFPGWDLERKDGTVGGSALHAAAGFPPRSAPTISVLLAAGADANSATDAGPDALMLIAAKDDLDTEAVQLLLSAGIDVNRQSHPLTIKWTLLLTMARAAWHFGRRSPLVDTLARSEGATALHRAWSAKHVRMAEMLERAGADVTLCNYLGQKPKDAIA